jgi:hypothetical protein
MNKSIKWFCLAGLISLIATGCATTGGNNPVNPAVATAVVETASAIGTQYAISTYPETRPYFVLTDKTLQALVTSNTVSFAEVSQAINAIEANDQYAALIALGLADSLTIIQSYTEQNTNLTNIRPYVVALDSGIQAGLAATTPAAKASTNQVRSVKFLKLNK